MSTRKVSGSSIGVQPAASDLWTYAVPPDEEPIEQAIPVASTKQTSYSSRPRQPLSTNVNANARPKTRSKNKSIQGLDTAYNAGNNLRPPAARDQGEGSDTGSGADSLLDLYKPSKESLRATSKDRQRVRRKGSQGAVAALKDSPATDDPDKWIHRDKLQQIEIQEMMAEGRRLDFPSRNTSRRGTSQMGSVVDESEAADDEAAYSHDKKRQRMASPVLSSDELQEDQEAYNDTTNGNDVANRAYHPRRPSTSRIPIKGANNTEATTSPTTTNSANRTGTRVRSTSQSSTNMLDTPTSKPFSKYPGGYSTPTTTSPLDSSPQASPPKPRSTNRTPSSLRGRGQTNTRGGARSASATTTRPRTASSAANSPQSRPGTSGARPTTAKPEGEPPWLATMYKPDPRLPPDQQMLPTHAKRLAGMSPEQRAGGHHDLTLLKDDEDEEAQRREARDEYLDSLGAQQPDTPQGSVRGSPQKQQKQTLSPNGQALSKSQKRPSWNSTTGRRSPNTLAADQNQGSNGQWPLRSLSINKYAPQPTEPIYIDEFGMQQQQEEQQFPPQNQQRSPGSDTGSFQKPPSESSTGGGFSLRPPPTEQRGSARLSPIPGQLYPPTRPDQQVTRMPDVDEKAADEGKKKKGACGGCCIVM